MLCDVNQAYLADFPLIPRHSTFTHCSHVKNSFLFSSSRMGPFQSTEDKYLHVVQRFFSRRTPSFQSMSFEKLLPQIHWTLVYISAWFYLCFIVTEGNVYQGIWMKGPLGGMVDKWVSFLCVEFGRKSLNMTKLIFISTPAMIY